MNLYTDSSPGRAVPRQGYADFIKAAWILTDIITRYLELDFLETSMGYSVDLLVEVGASSYLENRGAGANSGQPPVSAIRRDHPKYAAQT